MFGAQSDLVLRDHAHVRFQKLDALPFQKLAHVGKRRGIGVHFIHVVQRHHVVRARLDGVFGDGVFVQIEGALDDEQALVAEHVRHAAGTAQLAAALGEGAAHVARGAVLVVGQGIDDQRAAADAVTFVHERFVVDVAQFARRLFDAALDIVVGHVVRLRLGDDVCQLAVGLGVGVGLRRHGDLAPQLGEDAAARRVRLALPCLNVMPFAMS